MNYRKLISSIRVLLIGLSCTLDAHANLWQISEQYTPVLTVSGGLATANIGHSQTLTRDNDYTSYRYVAQNSSSQRMIFGVYAGAERALNTQLLVQMGVGYYESGAFSSERNRLIQGVDATSSDQFSWHYKVRNQSLLTEAKLLGTLKKQIHPYLLLGLGASFNQAYDYTVKQPAFLTFTPQFRAHTETNFTYNLGLGIDTDISKNCRLGVGYRFANLGQANLGEGVLDNKRIPQTLRQHTLYMQSLLVQLTWRFEK